MRNIPLIRTRVGRSDRLITPISVKPTAYARALVYSCKNDSSAAATASSIQGQVNQLNADYAASKIQFTYGYRFCDSTTYRQFADSEETAMKNAWNSSPSTKLNVYVVNISAGYLGVGTFPWE